MASEPKGEGVHSAVVGVTCGLFIHAQKPTYTCVRVQYMYAVYTTVYSLM